MRHNLESEDITVLLGEAGGLEKEYSKTGFNIRETYPLNGEIDSGNIAIIAADQLQRHYGAVATKVVFKKQDSTARVFLSGYIKPLGEPVYGEFELAIPIDSKHGGNSRLAYAFCQLVGGNVHLYPGLNYVTRDSNHAKQNLVSFLPN